MKDRIRQLMESQHMTQQTFAQFIEMSPASLSSIFNGRTKPTLNTVEAIRNKIPAISLDWLLYGKGPMFLDEAPSPESPTSGSGDLMLDFGQEMAPVASELSSNSPESFSTRPYFSPHNKVADASGMSGGQRTVVKPEVKIIERVPRQITEIRVFFDDLTFESFVPKK